MTQIGRFKYSHSSNVMFLEWDRVYLGALHVEQNFPLAINKHLGWHIPVTKEQCETLLGGQAGFGKQF